MTQVYLGGDRYEVYFNSGTMVIMSKEDIEELVNDSEDITELVEDHKLTIERVEELEKALECIDEKIGSYEDDVLECKTKRRKYRELTEDFTEDVNLIIKDHL